MIESEDPDSIDSIDSPVLAALRHEVLQLRDALIGEQAKAEVLTARIHDLERNLSELDEHTQSMQRILDRSPIYQARRVFRRLRRMVTRS